MSEVALVAAITGGTSVLTSAITAAVTWSATRSSSAVELARLHAENEQLQQANREEERRNRQRAYHEFIDASTLVFQILGVRISAEQRKEKCSAYNHLLSGVLLFGPPSVREGARALNRVYSRIWAPLKEDMEQHPGKSHQECWYAATVGLREEYREANAALLHLMHADVTHGIAEDPEG